MGKILQFESCATGGEWNGVGKVTPTSYYYIGVAAPASLQTRLDTVYTGTELQGQVTGIGYGWQKFIVPSAGKITFTVRGAAGGCTGNANMAIDPVTGVISGTGNRGGRGAKICGTAKLKKNDILYILVGMRGWCNTNADFGGGGGGASVVLLDNPAGAYTFSPLNRKVDVLFVAGGGGGSYDTSFGTAYYGKDAVITDGINTNGGTSNGSRGGAGLTGNGGSGPGGNQAYSILSGTPTTTSLNTNHQGGWGGGGGSWNGGGGGGGYSGGNASDPVGGDGGTSYINPNLCTEISRGYATIAEDGDRNLTNPWTAYGFVELELGRDEGKFILAHDADGYKYFDGNEDIHGTNIPGVTNEWQLLQDQSTPTDATYAMYGARVITNAIGLKSPVRFLVSSPEPQESISIDGHVAGSVIKLTNDASLADVSTLTAITATTDLAGTTTKFAVSKDYGTTWQTYNSGVWTDIDISNLQNFKDNGYDMSFFSAIPLTNWQAYNAKTLRFAFYITQNANTGSKSILSAIDYVADLVGSWKHFTEAQASYEYITDDTVEVTFKEAGNYKVNYLDSIT